MNKIWKFIHRLIIFNFLVEIIYSTYMVFFVIGGSRWPLFMKAIETPLEVITKRRLYALETWLAIGGLCIYLAITEVLPRRMPVLLDHLQAVPGIPTSSHQTPSQENKND
jgi:hypothetical protein